VIVLLVLLTNQLQSNFWSYSARIQQKHHSQVSQAPYCLEWINPS